MIFDSKVALVTGAVGGIGSAIVRALVANGASVGMVDTNAAAGKALEAELKAAGHKVLYASADVGQFAECEAAFSAIKAELGPIDILVNNVGISPKHDGKALKVWEMSPQEWNTVVSVNLNSAFYMTRLVTPAMVQKREGRIRSEEHPSELQSL